MNDKTQLILNFINESSSNMPYVLKDKLIRDGKKLKYRFEFEEIKNSIDEFIEWNELNRFIVLPGIRGCWKDNAALSSILLFIKWKTHIA